MGRLLDEIDLKPHRVQGWLNPKYNGTHVICTNETSGIQDLEHCHPRKQAGPGYSERYENEYKRHGTTRAITSRNVVTGEILSPLIQPTRKEDDFVAYIQQVVETDPNGKFIFVMDQLNTHKSEALVKFVIEKY